MKKVSFFGRAGAVLGLGLAAALAAAPAAQARNDANTVFNGISAATGVIGIFQNGKMIKQNGESLQMQQNREYREYQRDQAAARNAEMRAAANRRAAANKAAAERKAAEAARIQAAAAQAKQEATRKAELDSLKF